MKGSAQVGGSPGTTVNTPKLKMARRQGCASKSKSSTRQGAGRRPKRSRPTRRRSSVAATSTSSRRCRKADMYERVLLRVVEFGPARPRPLPPGAGAGAGAGRRAIPAGLDCQPSRSSLASLAFAPRNSLIQRAVHIWPIVSPFPGRSSEADVISARLVSVNLRASWSWAWTRSSSDETSR